MRLCNGSTEPCRHLLDDRNGDRRHRRARRSGARPIAGAVEFVRDGTGADATLVTRFERAVTTNADHIAVRFGSVEYTYGELDERANRVARILIGAGVGPESLVAVALPRSVDLVVALLATLKAGGGYLPIDPYLPRRSHRVHARRRSTRLRTHVVGPRNFPTRTTRPCWNSTRWTLPPYRRVE